ncbi:MULTISPECIES: AAA family ATPase [Streptomyces]|uniref:AAA family ATPase n=1 Tax=Streptomyces olivaceus TaxID=47716 RepID=A0ABS7WF91_STROV|nr:MULTISPECIES: AAA family ATPase [Streptomyces]AOW85330.1 ATPase [Streptomyces olivaceus]MBZ6084209.1 AAA family ATPase [Streptomyces olivaceus]MBZ6092972.1 AAA family ATPase [Streptomyces olivaceus]MBZ6099989.1 AAA family ATPase [Streptomyces olivaceus]MBZ6113919.1 AAA family ATPase [Streptomyces olivaceus]
MGPQDLREAQPAEDTAAGLRAIGDELSDRFYERADVVRTLLVTLLAGQHSLVLGPPGTAKSEMARELTGRIEGASYWEILLSKFTAPTRMFGPIDVAALARGEYRQVYDGRATTAHVAFIDEIFKCSTAALNETLGYLNERIYHPESGGEPVRCPLIGAITASNELPDGEDSAAIYDRLLVRIEVKYLEDPSNFAALVRSAVSRPAAPTRTTVELAALRRAVAEHVPAVDVPDLIVDAVCTLRAALRRRELVASDRRWRQAVGLLQASAYLDGRRSVTENDLSVLTHVLWNSPAERPAVEREVLHLVNPDAKEALDLADTIDELEAQLDAMAGQSREALSEWVITKAHHQLATAGRRLERLREEAVGAGRSTAAVDRVTGRQRAVRARVLTEALGVDASAVQAQL